MLVKSEHGSQVEREETFATAGIGTLSWNSWPERRYTSRSHDPSIPGYERGQYIFLVDHKSHSFVGRDRWWDTRDELWWFIWNTFVDDMQVIFFFFICFWGRKSKCFFDGLTGFTCVWSDSNYSWLCHSLFSCSSNQNEVKLFICAFLSFTLLLRLSREKCMKN